MPLSSGRALPALGDPTFFVGRERELETIARATRDAHAGRGRPLLLVGEPGIGKTRTIEELVRRSTVDRHRVLWGRAPEQEGVPAYWPWLQVLRRHLDQLEDAAVRIVFGPDAQVLARLLPALKQRIPGLEAAPRGDPALSRFALFAAISRALRRASSDEPLILVLEDLHWADDTSLHLLFLLAEEMRDARFAILATARRQPAWRSRELFTELVRASTVVDLGGLSHDEVGRFLSDAAGATSAPAALVDELHDATSGNPFFLGEVVQYLTRHGALDAHIDREAFRPSDGVRAFIRRHLEPLSPPEIQLLTLASVLGREFDLATLGEVSRQSTAEVLAALATPTELRVVEATDDPARHRFAHALIGETLYGDLSPAERAQRHLTAARSLERMRRGREDLAIAEIATHYYHAAPLGYGDRAAEFSAEAGRRAVAQLAFEDGVSHFERALAALALQSPKDREQLDLHLALASAALRSGDNVKARQSFEAALPIARATADATSFARAAYGIGSTRVEANDADPALIAALTEALEMLPREASGLRASLHARLAVALYFTTEIERREASSEAAIAMARELDELTTLAGALISRHLMLWGVGSTEERLRLIDEAIALAATAGHRGLLLEARTWRLVDLLEAGDMASAEIELGRYTHDAIEMRFPKHRRYATSVRAALAIHAGSFSEAEALGEQAKGMAERRRDSSIEQVSLSQAFDIRRETGASLADIAGGVAEQAHAQRTSVNWRAGFALLELERGHPERARSLIGELAADDFASVPRDGNFLQTMAYCAEVVAWLGEAKPAEQIYELLLPFAGRQIVVGCPPVGHLGSVARYLGLAAASAGRHDSALRHLDTAISENEATGGLRQAAHALVDLARVHLTVRPDSPEGAECLQRGLDLAERLSMRALLSRAPTAGPRSTTTQEGERSALTSAGARPEAGSTGSAAADSGPHAIGPFHATCRREGDFWTVVHAGKTARIKDAKGLAYLLTLLRHPGREVHVLELETGSLVGGGLGAGARGGASPGGMAAAGLVASRGGDAGELLDPEARSAYRARLDELAVEIAAVRASGDDSRAGEIDQEIEFLSTELSRGVGLGGRSRRAASVTERSRLNVTRSLSRVLRRIAESHPALGAHLQEYIKTGIYCSYDPPRGLDVTWDL